MTILSALGKSVKSGANGLVNDLTGRQLNLFFKDSEQTSFDFGQKSNYYLDGQPRLKFQYFTKIKFNPLATDTFGDKFVEKYLNPDEVAMLVPLTKSVSLPSMNIDTKRLNQYNHWKLSQSKIDFEPIEMSMHDVVDGKTLRFWEMYYEYYFKDTFLNSSEKGELADNDVDGNLLDSGNPYLDSIVYAKDDGYDYSESLFNDVPKLSIEDGTPDYKDTSAYSENFDSTHGFNIEIVKNQKHLIEYIEIYQYHAGRWSMVHMVNPVISKFQHDTLDYSNTSDTGEMKFTIEYEYALYHNYYSLFETDADGQLTKNVDSGADKIFKWSNSLEIPHPKPATDFKVRKRVIGPTAKLEEKIGTLPNNSLLGNLVSDISDVLTTAPDKIGDSVINAVKTGEWEDPIDLKAVKNALKGKAKDGAINIGTKNLKSTASGVTGAFVDFRRT